MLFSHWQLTSSIFVLITLGYLQEIDGLPQVNKASNFVDTRRVSKERKGFKYVPLNSMTLSARKPASQTSTDDEDTSGEQKSNEASSGAPSTKRPWWQSLPAKKKNKNQVILDEYEKIKSTLPEWPWMSALKNGNTPTGLTRSKLTNRVVVTTSNKPETSISSTTTTTTLKPMEESSTIMNQEDLDYPTTLMQEEEPKMTTKKMEELPAWLQSVNSKTTTKTPDWFASFTTAKSAMTTEEEESNPFQYKLKSGVASNFPVIEVNGPSIKLPSFPILSAPISMYSDIESRTDYGSQNADFDLEFFPQRMDGEDDKNTKFTLLVNEPKLGDLETTTTQRPLVTQSLSPMENREALSQLVSLYERAPILVKGETDKTQSKVMEKDKNTITMKMDPDYDEEKHDDMMMEESAEKLVKYEVSGGIPPSITLQLAASKGPLKSSTSSPMASTGIQHNLMQNSLQKMEMKSTGGDRKERVKATLQELLECNHDMMQTVQKQLAQQTNLLRTLMELL